MEQVELVAERRVVKGKQVKQLRNNGVIPSVVYGHEIGSIPIQIPEKPLRMALAVAGTNRLIALNIQGDKKPTLVLAREVQRDVIKGTFLHVDFQAVVMTEKIGTDLRLNFINRSPAVVDGSGMLLYNLDTIEIECLPADLISSIDVDLS
ncbi:MAG: 50S ribosomal protein L25, partial [Anaerolineales bacterium]|nr:50S ribosomal protein L25 [Anaerolineales bacterium]